VKAHIYISVGWISFAICISAMASCEALERKYEEQTKQEALKLGYERVAEKHSGHIYTFWRKDN